MIQIGIINYNGNESLDRCLDSIFAMKGVALKVWVFDNASSQSLESLEKKWKQVHWIKSSVNHGYAGACNRLLQQMETGICVLANMDLTFDQNWGWEISKTFEENPAIASVASLVLHQQDHTVNNAGILFFPDASPRSEGDGASPEEYYNRAPWQVFGCYGAVMSIRKEWWEQAGEFSEDFFLFFEETEWYLRLNLCGGITLLNPAARVYHFRSLATVRYSPLKLYLPERNRIRTLIRHFPVWYWPIAFGWSIIRFWCLSRGGIPASDARGNKVSKFLIIGTLLKAWISPFISICTEWSIRRRLHKRLKISSRNALAVIRRYPLSIRDL
ncbi:MAG: glycosyltransferase family 2 protein [Chitinivibrionales bacterium]